MQWLKDIYEIFGTPYPWLSLIVVMALGAATSGGIWYFAAKQVAKDHASAIPRIAPAVTGPASTTGSNSPAVTGSDNSITYGQPPNPEKKPPPKKE